MKAIAVTGFVPNAFPAKHLDLVACRALGDRVVSALGDDLVFFDNCKLQDCWAAKFLWFTPQVIPACAHPPADRFADPQDMVASNVVLLQRYWWMREAARRHPDADVFAWVEYTVFKQHGVTEEVLQNFLKRIEHTPHDAISLPGCWPKGIINDAEAHWRFCGSAWVCPREYLNKLFRAIDGVVTLRTDLTGKLSMDMNSMAFVELMEVLPIRWYEANHDASQFDNYGPLP